MNETPTPPEGYRIIPRAYLEAGNPLPGDAIVWFDDGDGWEASCCQGGPTQAHAIAFYATAQPLPCFQKGGDEPCPPLSTINTPGSSAPTEVQPLSAEQEFEKLFPVPESEKKRIFRFQSPDQGQWTEGKHTFPPERVAPAEHNPDSLSPEQYGAPEWRLLLSGERIEHGDQWFARLSWKWVQVERSGTPFDYATYRRRVAPEPTAEQARNIEGDFEEPEYTRLKAQKDAIVERENERLRDEGRKSVVLIRCINCLSVPQQNKSEITEAECGGCIAKERDAALARIAELERERDEARGLFESMRKLHKHAISQWAECVNMLRDARAQLAASEKDREALKLGIVAAIDIATGHADPMPSLYRVEEHLRSILDAAMKEAK